MTIARELERDYGYEQKQAEGVSTIIYRHLVGNVATKDDLKHAKEELADKIKAVDERLTDMIEGVEGRLTDKIQDAQERVTYKMTIRLGGIVFAGVGFLAMLLRFLPVLDG